MVDAARKKHLRKFGLVMAVPLLVLAGFLLYKGRPAWPYFAAAGGLFGSLGLVWPSILDRVERGWMWLAGKMQIVMTTLILSLAYFLMVTPIGLFFRIKGRDVLERKRREVDSYWKAADREGSAARPTKPY